MRVVAVPNPHFPPDAEAMAQADVVLGSVAELTPELVGLDLERLAVAGHEHAVDRAVGVARLEAMVDRLEVHRDDRRVGRLAHAANVVGVHHDRVALVEARAARVHDHDPRPVVSSASSTASHQIVSPAM